MNAICFKCGMPKAEPLGRCGHCAALPSSEDDLARSLMLTTHVLDQERMHQLSERIRSGHRVELSPEMRFAMVQKLRSASGIRKTRRDAVKLKARVSLAVKLVLLLAALLAFVRLHPSPQFKLAGFDGSAAAYKKFVERFPGSSHAKDAREKIRVLEEDRIWAAADDSGDISLLRSYRDTYPQGKFTTAAAEQIQAAADRRWRAMERMANKPEILQFLGQYPETTMKDQAAKRLTALADELWSSLAGTATEEQIRSFLKDHPETSKQVEARARILELAEERWDRIAAWAGEVEAMKFLEDYPETTKKAEVEARLEAIRDTFEWVRAKDTLEVYRRFFEKHPDHPQSAWIEKRIIDLEVDEIAEGNYGSLPSPMESGSGGTVVTMHITNDTGYVLTLRYSGEESKKLVIEVGGSAKLDLRPGKYRVAGSVSAEGFSNYLGTETYGAGEYTMKFWVQTRYSPGGK